MKRKLSALIVSFALSYVAGGIEILNKISQSELDAIYNEIKTPYKYGVILAPEKGKMLDNPSVFRHGDKWLMYYIVFDGKGYETHTAESTDLLTWKPLGCVFKRSDNGAWDSAQADGAPQLLSLDWDGNNEINKFDGKYWMTYIGGEKHGYETDPLSIGVAWTQDSLDTAKWSRQDKPILSTSDIDVRSFEAKTLYKSYVIEDEKKRLGYRFVMYYNAKQKGKWVERIGMAVSDDMKNWKRFGIGPCIANPANLDNGLSGDPMIRRIGDTFVMFYFGYNWDGKNKPAFDTFAASKDLVNWTRWEGKHLIESTETWDRTHAHKPWVIKHNGVVYHFYCAVGSQGRVLALATSKPLR